MDSSAPPPPYTPQLQQFSMMAPVRMQNGTAQGSLENQNPFPYGQAQSQADMQQGYNQSPLGYSTQQPMQQPFQHPPDIAPQQQQQLQQIIQNLPPEKVHLYQQQAQQMMNPQTFQPPQQMRPQGKQAPVPHYTTTPPSGLFGPKHPSSSSSSSSSSNPANPKDEEKSGGVKRFFGDTLFGRVARSSVQTVTTTIKIPKSLSPWGDNNPVTLPNVRYRDAVLFTAFAFAGGPLVEGISDSVTSLFGAESFVSEIVASGAGSIMGSTMLKYSIFQIVEQAIDKGIVEHMLPEEEKMLVTTGVKSLQVGIKHKLMGVDADLRFVDVYPSRDPQGCEKGWFCPYLFASARTPSVPRANDFGICQFFGPFLGGDYLLAHKLLAESTHTLALCDPVPQTDIGTNRLVILFTGIAPYRANMWSTSRRPGCGTIIFHLLDGCPALVIPVTSRAPICAWSPWTLSQMRASQSALNPDQGTGGGYQPEWQHEQLCEYLDTIISVPHLKDSIRERYVEVLGRMVSLVINGALALDKCRPVLGKLDPERAGIVMFRY